MNLEVINVTNQNGGAVTLGLATASQAQEVNNVNSTTGSTTTISNIAASATTLGVYNIDGSRTIFNYNSTVGAQETDLVIDGVTQVAAIHQVDLNGVETVNVQSNGGQANSIQLYADAATTLTISGDQDIYVNNTAIGNTTVNVSLVDATQANGDVHVGMSNQTGVSPSTNISVLGGAGDDQFDLGLVTSSNLSVDGGLGSDLINLYDPIGAGTSLTVGDTIVGGLGQEDELQSSSAGLAGTYTNISGIEKVSSGDALANDVTLSNIQAGIQTVELNGGTSLSNAAATRTITFDAGVAGTVQLNQAMAVGATASDLTVAVAGSGLTDSVTIANNNANGVNVFASTTNVARNLAATGVETLNVDTGSGVFTAQTIGTIGVTGSVGATTAETVNFSGDNTVAVGAITADIINASGLTAINGTVFNMTAAAAGAATITGSGGNDVLTGGAGAVANSIEGGAGNDIITGGAGNDHLHGGAGADSITASTGADHIEGGEANDRVVFATAGDLTTADTVDGGVGTNTLVATAIDLTTNAALPAASNLAGLNRVTNIQTVEVTGVGAAAASNNVNVNAVSSGINTVNTVAVTGGTASTFTFNSGASTLNLGTGAVAAALGAATTLVAAGSGAADALTIVKNSTNNENVLGGQALTVTGIETLNINSGSTAVALAQSTGAISLTATGTNPAASINVTGANVLTLGAVTNAGTGLLTIDASGMTAQAAGTTTFTLTAPVTTGGTVSVIGTAGQDVLNGDANDKNTIYGGAGVDTINGGSNNDYLDGGTGIDTITTNGGNDTVIAGDGNDVIDATAAAGTVSILGGAGNDTVNIGATLNSGDVLDGGEGVNIFRQSTALIASFGGVTNFSTLQLDAAMTQNLALFTGTTFSELDLSAAGAFTLSNVADGTQVDGLNKSTITAVTHASNTTTNTLSIGGLTAGGSTVAVTANDTDTLTFNAGHVAAGSALTITGLNAIDASQINVTGVANQDITVAIDGAATGFGNTAQTVTIDASGNTGTFTWDGSLVTLSRQAVTGSANAVNDIQTGAAADTITGGVGSDTIVGGAGGDTINVSTGAADVVLYTVASQSAVITSVATGQVYTGIDLVSGEAAGDVLSFLAAAVSAGGAYTSGAAGAVANNAFNTTISYAALVDNGASLIRGNYDTLTGVWTTSATGADTLYAYDQNATFGDANQSYVGVVLVGTAGVTTSTAAFVAAGGGGVTPAHIDITLG